MLLFVCMYIIIHNGRAHQNYVTLCVCIAGVQGLFAMVLGSWLATPITLELVADNMNLLYYSTIIIIRLLHSLVSLYTVLSSDFLKSFIP